MEVTNFEKMNNALFIFNANCFIFLNLTFIISNVVNYKMQNKAFMILATLYT